MNLQTLKLWHTDILKEIASLKDDLPFRIEYLYKSKRYRAYLAASEKLVACGVLMVFEESKATYTDEQLNEILKSLLVRSAPAWERYNHSKDMYPHDDLLNADYWNAWAIDALIEKIEAEISKRAVAKMTKKEAYAMAYALIRSGVVNEEITYAYGVLYDKALESYHAMMQSECVPYTLAERAMRLHICSLDDAWLEYEQEFDNE